MQAYFGIIPQITQLKLTFQINFRETGFGVAGGTYMAQDRDRWRALVNSVMNLQVI
jgi:hypothetical protein